MSSPSHWVRETTPRCVVSIHFHLSAYRSTAAIACFAATPSDFEFAIGRTIGLGTDTLAAMTGAFAGLGAVPAERIVQLEEQGKGGRYVAELAEKLHARYASAK